eukprot:GEMP01021734.1.p1 GENE.GEMP01021734.1~~GEMP01021734.1.p1  ORF type:complete len:396 (+),score=81.50 GEMP01021734.1:851-2038(+)
MTRPDTTNYSAKFGGRLEDRGVQHSGKTKISHTTGQLPRGWVEYQTSHGEVFFHNFYTDESRWERPVSGDGKKKFGKGIPPKMPGHVRSGGRSTLPPCLVMVVVSFMMFIGLLKGLWCSVMKFLGFGPTDPDVLRMVEQEQDEFVSKLDRSEVYLSDPLKPPDKIDSKPGLSYRSELSAGMLATTLTAATVDGGEDAEKEFDVEAGEILEAPDVANFTQWAPKLASIWGKWLPDGEGTKLHRLVNTWSEVQALQWELADRPLDAARSEGAPDLERISTMKSVLHKLLGEHDMHEVRAEFKAIREESARNSNDIVDKLEEIKMELRREEFAVQADASNVEKRSKIIMECDPSYSFKKIAPELTALPGQPKDAIVRRASLSCLPSALTRRATSTPIL